MCATQPTQPSNQKPNSNSHGKTRPSTHGASQKPQRSREDKRKAWAKRSKPVAKPSVRVGPVKAYTSVCCSAPATKPKAGTQEMQRDPESGKSKSQSKGLGHWHCSACGKGTSVTVNKAVKETSSVQTNVTPNIA